MALTWAVFIGTTFCRNGRLITHLCICIVLCSGIHVQLLQTYSFWDAITKLCYFAHQSINLILAVIPFKVILFRALLGTGAFPGFFFFKVGWHKNKAGVARGKSEYLIRYKISVENWHGYIIGVISGLMWSPMSLLWHEKRCCTRVIYSLVLDICFANLNKKYLKIFFYLTVFIILYYSPL